MVPVRSSLSIMLWWSKGYTIEQVIGADTKECGNSTNFLFLELQFPPKIGANECVTLKTLTGGSK